MPVSFIVFLGALRSLVRSRVDLQIENLALRQQIVVLQCSVRKRPKPTSRDRLFWLCLSCICRDWRSILVIVKPEPVVAWHRKGFRLFWTWKPEARLYKELVGRTFSFFFRQLAESCLGGLTESRSR